MQPILEPILECCCGVDVHKNMIEACIIKGIYEPIFIRKRFSTFQNELIDFAHWLYEHDCYHIAMESTGVYWRPIYEAIESIPHTMKISSLPTHTTCVIFRAEKVM